MKKIHIGISALLFSACVCQAQDQIAMKYAKLITAEDAKKHLSILASDAFEGRETGKPGAAMAANYLAGEFKKLGLQAPVNGSYFQDIPLLETSFLIKSFTVNGMSFANQKDFYNGRYRITSNEEKEINSTEIVFLGHKVGGDLAAELGNTDIKGKIVFIVNDGETIAGVAKRIEFLQKKQPQLIITTSAAINNVLSGPRSKNRPANAERTFGMSIKTDTQAPQAALVINVSTAVATQIFANSGETFETFMASGDANGMQPNQTIKADIKIGTSSIVKDAKAVDVLGYLPGTDLKNEVLVFSAHYDHIGLTKNGTDKVNNGADDDGSGTTGILEIARAFTQAQKDGHGPRRSILFLGNVGEEKGLLGSEYYTDHPVFPLANTITDLNIDMIGRVGNEYIGKADSANYVYVIGSAMLSSELHKIGEDANKKYTKLLLDYKYDDPNDPNRFYYRSDHYNFAKHGVPIIFYFNGVHADYHQPTDEVSKINFPLLAKRAQLVFYTGWELANRDKRPLVDVK